MFDIVYTSFSSVFITIEIVSLLNSDGEQTVHSFQYFFQK